jgi:hypothetical protein
LSEYIYVGRTPRSLSSGRPITFGSVIQESELEQLDAATRAYVVPSAAPAQKSQAEAPAPAAPAPAETPAPAPAPQEVVTTGNPPATPEPEAK